MNNKTVLRHCEVKFKRARLATRFCTLQEATIISIALDLLLVYNILKDKWVFNPIKSNQNLVIVVRI